MSVLRIAQDVHRSVTTLLVAITVHVSLDSVLMMINTLVMVSLQSLYVLSYMTQSFVAQMSMSVILTTEAVNTSVLTLSEAMIALVELDMI